MKNQLKIFIPVGIDINIVQYIKNEDNKKEEPKEYIWWPQTIKDIVDIINKA
ncbi:hypothetical protein NDNC_0810 [Candidatus Nasuia deltocephalinicola]|nr:hypothetical protein NDNC_0810 [Candidatus Nasuia deltocephalinicola]